MILNIALFSSQSSLPLEIFNSVDKSCHLKGIIMIPVNSVNHNFFQFEKKTLTKNNEVRKFVINLFTKFNNPMNENFIFQYKLSINIIYIDLSLGDFS